MPRFVSAVTVSWQTMQNTVTVFRDFFFGFLALEPPSPVEEPATATGPAFATTFGWSGLRRGGFKREGGGARWDCGSWGRAVE